MLLVVYFFRLLSVDRIVCKHTPKKNQTSGTKFTTKSTWHLLRDEKLCCKMCIDIHRHTVYQQHTIQSGLLFCGYSSLLICYTWTLWCFITTKKNGTNKIFALLMLRAVRWRWFNVYIMFRIKRTSGTLILFSWQFVFFAGVVACCLRVMIFNFLFYFVISTSSSIIGAKVFFSILFLFNFFELYWTTSWKQFKFDTFFWINWWG